jgi:CPA1 family monovalent cation:H+ antiporter
MIVAALDVLARKIGLPYPVLLVLSGRRSAWFRFSARGLRSGACPARVSAAFALPGGIVHLVEISDETYDRLRAGLGLVLTTTVSVASVAQAMIPDLPWAAALILGAIVSPPDAIAATAVLQRMKIPRRIVAILEGESLLNDSIALVIYRFGIVAVVTGSFSLTDAVLRLPVVGLGGVLIGWIVSAGIHWLQRRLDDPPVQITISLLTPSQPICPQTTGSSGVLAVVTRGYWLAFAPNDHSAHAARSVFILAHGRLPSEWDYFHTDRATVAQRRQRTKR